jgi:hypothetical protein
LTLEFKKISKLFAQISAQAAERQERIDAVVPRVWQILQEHSLDTDLRDRAQAVATEQKWRGAIPTREPLDLVQDPPKQPTRYTIIAGDGSQIYPDLHGAVLYYLINVGTIVYRHGSGNAPTTETTPTIRYESDMEFDQEEQSVLVPSTAEVDARRSLAEMEKVCELALAEPKTEPKLILMDGQMAFFANSFAMSKNLADRLLHDYLHLLEELRVNRVPVAGFFSRRTSMMVTSLARLAISSSPPDQAVSAAPPFEGVPDTAIFAEKLGPGQRSAVFEIGAKWNIDVYRQAQHSIHFFYVNVGSAARPEIARIEAPEWVATNRALLDLIHGAVVAQSQPATGYPYVLSRAHEIAVVRNEEQATLEEMLLGRLATQGIYLYPSGKARAKDVLVSATRS